MSYKISQKSQPSLNYLKIAAYTHFYEADRALFGHSTYSRRSNWYFSFGTHPLSVAVAIFKKLVFLMP